MKLIDELYDTIRFVNETPNAVFEMDKIEDIFAAIEDKLQFYEKSEQALEIIKKTFDMKLVVPVPKGGYELQIMNKGSFVIYTYANISKEDYDLLKEVLL